MAEDDFFVPTKGSLRKSGEINHQIAVHASRKSKRKTQADNKSKNEKNNEAQDTVNVKRLKHEIVRFAMSGMPAKDAKEAKIQLAVKLGAKPLKNKYKNYKTLLQERKKEMEKEKLEKQLFKVRTEVKPKLANKQKKKGGILGVYGKVDDKDKTKVRK